MANDLRGSYGTAPKQARIPALADAADSRSWYACSRSRVATGLLLTAPGVPMLFMGQELLEDISGPITRRGWTASSTGRHRPATARRRTSTGSPETLTDCGEFNRLCTGA